MTLFCPDCSAELTLEVLDGVNVDVCLNCAGAWFGEDDLRALIAHSPANLTYLEEHYRPKVTLEHVGDSGLACPVCKVFLQVYHYAYDTPILMHACPKCGGLWVRNGELGAIESWIEKSRLPATEQEKALAAIVQGIGEHEEYMMRQRNLLGLFNMFRHYPPGWIGLA